jgi:PAS domain S-box-containing protein
MDAVETRNTVESAGQPPKPFEAEALLRLGTEGSPIPTVFTRGERHVVHHGNPAFGRLVGASPEALVGTPLLGLFAEAGDLTELLDRVYHGGVSDLSVDMTYTGPTGTITYGTIIACPLLHEPASQPGLMIWLIDTTEQVRARRREVQMVEEAARANAALLLAGLREHELAERAQQKTDEMNALLANMTEGVVVADGGGHIVLMNPVGRRILGFSEVPTLEEYCSRQLWYGDGTRVPAREGGLSRALRGEQFSDEELLIVAPGGSQRHIVFSGSALRDATDAVVLAINVFRDVTKLRELEATREEYVSLVSHDLRGPLSVARIGAELLQSHPETLRDPRGIAAKVVRSLDRTDRMVRNLLDAHRIRAGKRLPLELERCNLTGIAQDVAEELSSVHGDRFRLQGEEDVWGYWSADELRRALWNLASNAVKYGAAEAPVIITLSRIPDGVRLSVHNQGTPIPAEDRALLFRAFSRVQAAGTAARRGWGLGLTLVLGCVEAHGGRVSIESTVESGTRFVLELPLDARPYQEQQ